MAGRARARRGGGPRRGGAGGRALNAARREAVVLTHQRPGQVAAALATLREAARRAGARLWFDPDETRKHRLEPSEELVLDAEPESEVDFCVALGGDGTILRGLRQFAGTGIPVFAINFGEVGFLATLDPDGLDEGFARAFSGDFEVLALPAIALRGGERTWTGINDISFHRKPGLRVADLAYAVDGEEIGRVRCDGLVVATPAGSTGYNLANGGPVMAWGVEGYVVSFIAPHSLTARALVVAPDDRLAVQNLSREEPADVTVDGRPACQLGVGETLEVRFQDAQAALAQIPGASFYHRLRERFGRLSS
jgi:NAD+ kinase